MIPRVRRAREARDHGLEFGRSQCEKQTNKQTAFLNNRFDTICPSRYVLYTVIKGIDFLP
jgi:hypothetical protein